MGGRIREVTMTVTTTGAAGSATGTAVTTESFEGFLLEVYLNFHASSPGTIDTTLKQTGATDNILVITSSNTDALYAPRRSLVTGAGAAITNGHGLIPIAGAVVATIRVQTL